MGLLDKLKTGQSKLTSTRDTSLVAQPSPLSKLQDIYSVDGSPNNPNKTNPTNLAGSNLLKYLDNLPR